MGVSISGTPTLAQNVSLDNLIDRTVRLNTNFLAPRSPQATLRRRFQPATHLELRMALTNPLLPTLVMRLSTINSKVLVRPINDIPELRAR